VLGGSPLSAYRLTEAGARFVDALERGDDVTTAGATGRLLDRFVDAGVVHPQPVSGAASPALTVVVPARDRDVGPLVAALGGLPVVVVDDGSSPPLTVDGAVVVRRPRSSGPGAARNAGLVHVDTPYVAFVDSDVELSPGWLEPLVAHLDTDPRVALVAPRVASSPGPGWLARYEAGSSPLDLGPEPARIRPGTRVSYVPAAVLVARTDAVRHIGGFDESLATGEDVDVVWRLVEAGWRCRYEPVSVVLHEPRATLAAWLAQRAGYGRSAGPLARRHPGALAPVRVNVWTAAAWAVGAAWSVPAGVTLGAATAALAARSDVLTPREAVRLAGRGHVLAGRQLGSALTRAWWPLAVLAALRWRRARVALLAAVVAPALTDRRLRDPGPAVAGARRHPLGFAAVAVALRLLDDGAYGWGLWQGAWRARTAAPLLPELNGSPPWARRRRRPR